jgi:agmatine/peptidylarginine deiminase
LFMIRDFGDDQRIDFEYKAWGGNGLSHFPPREGEDVTVAINELVDVFKRNFQEYANNQRNRRSARRPRR